MELMSDVLGQQPQVNAQQQGFAEAIQPPAVNTPEAPVAPAVDPAHEQRAGQWSQLMEDPNFRSSLLRFSLLNMQGQHPGQNVVGSIAGNAMDASNYYLARNQLDLKNSNEAQQLANRTKETNALASRQDAETAQTKQTMGFENAKFDEWKSNADVRVREASAKIAKLNAEGKHDEAQAALEAAQTQVLKDKQAWIDANPGEYNKSIAAGFQEPMAKLDELRAATSSHKAAAAAANSETNLRNQSLLDLKAAPQWVRLLPDKEAQTFALSRIAEGASQPVISGEIAAGKHRKEAGEAALDQSYLADALKATFNADPAAQKKYGGDIKRWVVDGGAISLVPGRSANELLKALATPSGTPTGVINLDALDKPKK